MKIFAVLILAAVVSGKPSSEEYSADYFNGNQFEQDGRWGDWEDSGLGLAGSSEELALASADWRMEALDYTNDLRAKAGLKPYKLDPNLSRGAQAWAQKSVCSGMNHDYSMNGFKAENLAPAWPDMAKGDGAKKGIDMWYNEHKEYKCSKVTINDLVRGDEYLISVLHFMNIMAKDKSIVGFGMAFCPQNNDETGVLVARYNYQGESEFDVMHKEQMKMQGTDNIIHEMDLAAMVPCTDTFTP